MQTIAYFQAANRAARAAAPVAPSRAAEWIKANTAAFEWLVDHCDNNTFAASLLDNLRIWGRLTDKQLLAVQNNINRAAIAKTKAETAPTVGVEPIEQAFAKAAAAGVSRPKLRLAEFTFSPAPATGKNPGAIYVKHSDGTYLGKVTGSRLFTVSAVSGEVEREIIAAAHDPLNAAIAYGKRYGKCSVCARTLTDEASIARGIGPVCAANYGW
jgi:hypothetical protein